MGRVFSLSLLFYTWFFALQRTTDRRPKSVAHLRKTVVIMTPRLDYAQAPLSTLWLFVLFSSPSFRWGRFPVKKKKKRRGHSSFSVIVMRETGDCWLSSFSVLVPHSPRLLLPFGRLLSLFVVRLISSAPILYASSNDGSMEIYFGVDALDIQWRLKRNKWKKKKIRQQDSNQQKMKLGNSFSEKRKKGRKGCG